jgi:hypothetical protein
VGYLATVLLFVVIGGCVVALVKYREAMRDDDRPTTPVDDETLIAMARRYDASRSESQTED